jgi:hypothetical protein
MRSLPASVWMLSLPIYSDGQAIAQTVSLIWVSAGTFRGWDRRGRDHSYTRSLGATEPARLLARPPVPGVRSAEEAVDGRS